MVSEWKAADPAPPLYRVQSLETPNSENVERDREGTWVETPKGLLREMAVERKVDRGGASFSGQYKSGVYEQ